MTEGLCISGVASDLAGQIPQQTRLNKETFSSLISVYFDQYDSNRGLLANSYFIKNQIELLHFSLRQLSFSERVGLVFKTGALPVLLVIGNILNICDD